MNKVFVSGVYRPEEDACNTPTRTIEQIVDTTVEKKRRLKAQRQNYNKRGTKHKRLYDRMVGSE